MLRTRLTALLVIAGGLLATPTAYAAPALPRGNDVSWPQCSKALGGHGLPQPSHADIEVIGLTHGLPFLENPCLETEISHARSIGARISAYTFAAMPTSAQLARDGGSGPYDATQPNGRLANAGYAQGLWASAMLGGYGLDVPFVWLDVEPRTKQPWSHDVAANQAVINGAVAALQATGRGVGFYSYAYGWKQITGGLRSNLPVWATAGHRGIAGTLAMCAKPSFSGGPVVLAQYFDDVRDSDVACPSIAGSPARTTPSALAPFARTVLKRGSPGGRGAAIAASAAGARHVQPVGRIEGAAVPAPARPCRRRGSHTGRVAGPRFGQGQGDRLAARHARPLFRLNCLARARPAGRSTTRWATPPPVTYAVLHNFILLIQRGRGNGPMKPRQPIRDAIFAARM